MKAKVIVVMTAVLVALALISTAMFFIGNAQRDREVAAARDEISAIHTELEQAKQANAAKNEQTATESKNMDSSRIAKDSDKIVEILTDMCTWETSEDYKAMRERVIKEYGISEDSWLVTAFLPALDEDYIRRIDHGGLNMSLADTDIRCLSEDNGVYSYFVQAEVSTTYRDQEASSICVFEFAIDSDGKIVSADGMLVSN